MERNKILLSLKPDLSFEQLKMFELYANILTQESKKMNLTSITDLDDIYIKHFYDSMLMIKTVDLKNKSLIDVGTGAGFPGIVLKIIEPSLNVTLVEPTTKRCNFLNLIIDKLKLTNITVINDRAEKYIKNKRETFDIATARAVANLKILLELLTPFIKENGYLIALKGSSLNEELNDSKNAINKLSLKFENIFIEDLPNEKGNRQILKLKKMKKTNELYPREYAKIIKNPL